MPLAHLAAHSLHSLALPTVRLTPSLPCGGQDSSQRLPALFIHLHEHWSWYGIELKLWLPYSFVAFPAFGNSLPFATSCKCNRMSHHLGEVPSLNVIPAPSTPSALLPFLQWSQATRLWELSGEIPGTFTLPLGFCIILPCSLGFSFLKTVFL